MFINDKLVDSKPRTYPINGGALFLQTSSLCVKVNIGVSLSAPIFAVFVNNQKLEITNFQGEEVFLSDVNLKDFEISEREVE